jgi:uncharacterized delta-60 repeat protein
MKPRFDTGTQDVFTEVFLLLLNSVRPAVFFVAVTLLPATAQAQAIEAWVQRYNGPENGKDYFRAMVVDANGNVYITGSSAPVEEYPWAWATIKYSSEGVPLWTNRYIHPGDRTAQAAALGVDASGNVYVTGQTTDDAQSYCATIKYSSDGMPLWTNRYTRSGVGGKALALDGTGSIFVVANGYNDTDYDLWMLKYSEAGALLWARSYRGSANAMAVDTDGNVVATGSSGHNYLTIKYSSAGSLLWNRLYTGPVSNDIALALAIDAAGNVVATGRSFHTNAYSDYATIKYSSAGVPLWTNRYDGPIRGTEEARAVAVDASGNVYVTGSSGASGSFSDYLTLKYSSAGVPLWTNRYNGSGNRFDEAFALTLDHSGNAYVAGQSERSGNSYEYAAVAYSSSGVPLWTNRYGWLGQNNDYGDRARSVAVDPSGSVYVSGFSATSGVYPIGYDFATVKYVVPPIITRQPLSCTNAVGSTAYFKVEAVGGTPLSYQWRRDGTNLVDGGSLSGVTTTNLSIANVQLEDACDYMVVVTNEWGSATSSIADLTVTIPPSAGKFTNLAYSPATGFSFIFRDGTVGQSYRIQRSPSMAGGSWADWQSFIYTEPNAFMDLGALTSSNRFYRAISPDRRAVTEG